MRELDEIFKATESDDYQWVAQKYIERPQLIHGYKFDIRQWVLVTDWNPLTVYVWQQPYLRFAGKKYDDSLSSLDEYMHLVNNSIIKYMDGFEQKNEELNASGYMWFRQQYEEWLHDSYCKCKRHATPWKKPPPYTCETFGVKWEDVAFTAKDEEDDEDDGAPDTEAPSSAPCPASTEATTSAPCSSSTEAPSSGPCSSSTEAAVEDAPDTDEVRPASPTDSDDQPLLNCPEGSEAPASPVADAPGLQACPCGRHFAPKAKFCKGCSKSRQMAEDEISELLSRQAAEAEEAKVNDSSDPLDDVGEDHVCENLWETCIKPQCDNIIAWSLLCVIDNITHRKNSYELYGYDFMLSEGSDGRPKVWLIEVNSSPACDYSTPVTTPLVKKMMEDIAKVVVDKKSDPGCDTGEWELLQHPFTTKVPKSGANMEKLEVCGSQIKPLKKKGKKKKKHKSKCEKSKAAGAFEVDALGAAATEEDDADADADDDEDDAGS